MKDDKFACLLVQVFSDVDATPEEEKQQIQERMAIVNGWVQNDCIPTALPEWCEITQNHGGGGGP